MASADLIFLEARELATRAEVDAYLTTACSGDEALRREVEQMLRAAAAADAYFGPADGLMPGPGAGAGAAVPSEGPGTVLGRYVLEKKIGEGGMGVVYQALQTEPVVRRVALKIIKLGMDTRRVVARFEAERQALAMMDHPNIARVLDAGSTEAGRPFFVMELVQGRPITDFCDRRRFSVRQRLELFIQVCYAVQHAHQKGIIHRDLKPSNVLVGEPDDLDGLGSPRVIDFGVAKAVRGWEEGYGCVTTSMGFVGTPAYMSPEQADDSCTDLDTRTDIYSLGVLLYELLTGRTPFDTRELSKKGLSEVVRTLRDSDPPRPSTRLAMLTAEERARVREARGSGRMRIEDEVRGDLEWIVMKCLEKDRSRRYSTANGLVRDIQRHLADQPVEARPASWRYRMGKVFRRNRVAMITGGVALLALVLATVISVRWAIRATQAERAQTQSRLLAEASAASANRNLYFAQMSQAQVFWDRHEFDRLRRLLMETRDSPHRSFEWFYWMRMAHLEAITYRGHLGSLSAIALSPDGTLMATGDGYPSLQLWEVASGRKIREIQGIKEPVKCVAFTPDGREVVHGELDGRIEIHEVSTGSMTRSFRAHESRVSALTLSADGRTLFTAGFDFQVKAWDLAERRKPRLLGRVEDSINALALSPDDRWLVVSSYDRKVRVWSVERNEWEGTLEAERDAEVEYCVAFSHDGTRLVGGDKAGRIRVWNTLDWTRVWSSRPHSDAVHSVVFSPDGRRVFSSGADRVIHISDAVTGQVIGSLQGHSAGVNSLAVTPNGLSLISGSSDRTAKVWDLDRRSLFEFDAFATFPGRMDWLQGLAYLPDNKRLLTYVKGAWIWDAGTGEPTTAFIGHPNMVYAAALSPDGSSLITGGEDKTLRGWRVADAQPLFRMERRQGLVRVLRFFPDNRRFLAGGDDHLPAIFDFQTGEVQVTHPGHVGAIRGAAISPDGRQVATGCEGGMTRVWDPAQGQLVREFEPARGPVVSLSFSPDGTRLLIGTGTPGERIRVMDLATGSEVFQKHPGSQGFHSATYSPDGRRILVVNESPTGELLDAETGREVLSLRGETELHRAGAFSPDGRHIALGTLGVARDHLLRIWTAATPEEAKAWVEAERGWITDPQAARR